jgi:NhaA family Na+:H+ antiporter
MPEVLFQRPPLSERLWLLRILRTETVGGVLMLAAAVVAIFWANSGASESYFQLVNTVVGPERFHLDLTLNAWAADFLLAFFFFLAGLELKHEIQLGTLSRPAQAAVPVVAAVAGMAVPALIYAVLNWADPQTVTGWGIPMATDIAFALAVLAIMGRGLPLALRAFLLTLAVVDDLGAIAVIAIFYSHGFHLTSFVLAVTCIVVWRFLQQHRVGGRWAIAFVYLPLALICWAQTHESGIHATVAGVALGLATRVTRDPGEHESPGERVEHQLRPFVAGFCVPVFALLSAGVDLRGIDLAAAITAPVTLGVSLGLLLGKPVGVIGGSYLMARFTRASLNPALRWGDVIAVGFLAGIGFTVSLLIAELAFTESDTHLMQAKLGIIGATVAAALIAAVMLMGRRRALAAYHAAEEADHDADGVPDVYRGEPGDAL